MIATLGAALVLLWVRASGTPWRDIGYVRPRSWIGDAAIGVAVGFALKLLLKAIVMPLLGADPINQIYHSLAGNQVLLVPAILLMLAAGVGEETVFRGFLFERLGRPFGSSAGAKLLIVLITTAAFASLHYPDQGWPGAEQAIFTGLAFGTIYAATGRLWLVMWAHAAYDLLALAFIYWSLESTVAHLFFK